MLTACDVGVVALLGGHPEVGGTSIENYLETLGRVADGNRSKILRLVTTQRSIND